MIRISSLRWRLVAWVIGVTLVIGAVVFVVVYAETGSQLRARVDQDVEGDLGQLAEAARTLRASTPEQLLAGLLRYVRAQPYSGRSSLLFAVVPGHPAVSNHPELLVGRQDDGDESAAQQRLENVLAQRLLSGPGGQRTALAPDVGEVRVDQRFVSAAGTRIRLGAGEALSSVVRAQRTVARAFVIAGAIGLALVLIASYLAGAVVSKPLRRMARVAARVDDGDLHPRMVVPRSASVEIRVLAESFNHMLERLATAFAQQRGFVADASHELRTPLTVIAGQLEVLAALRDPSREEIQRVQRLVSAEIARTSRLVDDMLLLAGSEQHGFLRPTAIELGRFVEDLWSTTTVGYDRHFRLGSVPEATLEADPDRLAQALRNLIDNAIAHTTAPDGRVSLHTVLQRGGIVRFTVTDDGPGIPDAERERIFDRFHRTDQARDRVSGGAGLGLAIVWAIADAHGGEVRALGAATGARFELDIPGARSLAEKRTRRSPGVRA